MELEVRGTRLLLPPVPVEPPVPVPPPLLLHAPPVSATAPARESVKAPARVEMKRLVNFFMMLGLVWIV